MNKFYITTAIPYVNGKPHIGHALEYFQADTIRRYHQALNEETLLLSGADENALKNVQAAEKEGMDITVFLDQNSNVFKEAFEALGVHLDIFQRGSDQEKHWPGVQKLWELCDKNGDIYKKEYTGLYCIGCESFKTESELVDGLCPDHKTKPEEVTEENYFFRLSKYQDQLLELINSGEFKITPENKKAEAVAFIKGGLEDFSISRSKDRAKGIGVPVPNDPDQVMYVWFDALNIYMTGIGFGWDEEMWKKWWPADLHIIGKDINRFHTVYWPAMLLSAGLPTPKEILIHGFITSGGQKMSKTIGNVIDPFEMVKKYGLEPFRYYLLSQIPIDSDGDFTEEKFTEVYNADLANGIGNLAARIAKLCEMNKVTVEYETADKFDPEFHTKFKEYKFNEILEYIWRQMRALDVRLNAEKPWELDQENAAQFLKQYVGKLLVIATQLKPFMPETAEKIINHFKGEIKAIEPLFPRLS